MPRKTVPGSNPSTNVAVIASLTSTLARHGIGTGLTVANRVALHKGILPMNNVGRGVLTTGHTKVGSVVLYRRGHGGVRRVRPVCLRKLAFRCIASVGRMLTLTLAGRGMGSTVSFGVAGRGARRGGWV